MEPMRFSLKLKEVPVTLEKKDGTEVNYILRELSGTARDAYLGQMAGKMKMGPGGQMVGVKNFDGIQASLLTQCLFVAESNEPVAIPELQEFPASVLDALFQKAQNLSALDKEGEDEAKNV